MKTSLVGKGIVPKKMNESVPAIIEKIITDTLKNSSALKAEQKKSVKKEPVYRGHLTQRKKSESVKKIHSDSLSQASSSIDSVAEKNSLLTSHTIQALSDVEVPAETVKSATKKKSIANAVDDGKRARIINVASIIFVIIGIVFFALQSSGFFSKRKPAFAKASTFTTEIGDENENIITYSRPKQKNIFDTISEREEERGQKKYEPLFHDEENEFEELQNSNLPVNEDTLHLAKQFRRGQGEVELAIKMSSHRTNVSHYSDLAVQIPAYESETPTGRKKDAGAIAKKLGIGKGEVLLARHLEEIEHKNTKG
ncbi:MAG: hypothetical protein AAB071_05530 [Bacteroidota bacterium]